MMIREATREDLPGLVRIDTQSNPYPWTMAKFASALNSNQILWVMEKDQEILGYLLWQKSLGEAEIYQFAVDENHRRQKIGQSLINKMIATCQENDTHTIFLEVRKSNLGAQAFYLENGFKQIGIRPNYYHTHSGQEDALIMRGLC